MSAEAMSILVDRGFTDSLVSLGPQEQVQVNEFLRRFFANPSLPGLRLEKLSEKTGGLWSARVNESIRVILAQDAGTWVLLFVGRHREAYAWAEKRRCERHAHTGELQLVAIRHEERVVTKTTFLAPPLFARHDDAYLSSLGVPPDWLPAIRGIRTEDELIDLLCSGDLPQEVQERLATLATGKLVPPPKPFGRILPVASVPEARQSFALVESEEELERLLAAPMEKWLAFLHPLQRDMVTKSWPGPSKVTGSAGTGKTVVAMHRARHLARQGKRVLVCSFVTTLCDNIERGLDLLCRGEDDVRQRITVKNVHGIAGSLAQTGCPGVVGVTNQTVEERLAHFAKRHGMDGELAFLKSEMLSVVVRQVVRTWDEYRDAKRTGRGTALGPSERKRIWPVFEDTLASIRESNSGVPFPTLCVLAREALVEGKALAPWDAVVVDEVQDLGPAEIQFLAHLGGTGPDGLTLIGDTGQRIYPGGFSLRALGIDVRGRSRVLRINYRTSDQIRRLADRLLTGRCDDMEEGEEPRDETISLLAGPAPTFRGWPDSAAEDAAALDLVRSWLSDGLNPADIGIFARTAKRLAPVQVLIQRAGIPTRDLGEGKAADIAGVSLGTMHRAKGLEFKRVLLIDVRYGQVPNYAPVRAAVDDEERREVEDRERNLLYVAMTRARDRLHVSWSGRPSPLLDPLLASPGGMS